MKRIDTLNPQQREAALHKDGPLLILAGAGSGKTSTIVHRIVHLITEEDVSPFQILAVTFTNKAAAEMNARVVKLLSDPERYGVYTDRSGQECIRGLWILTFHRFCLRVLRQNAGLVGFTDHFAICDAAEQKGVVKDCVKRLHLDEKKYAPAYCLSVISDAKGRGLTAETYAQEVAGSISRAPIAEVFRLYSQILAESDRMDFDDLICNTVRLFTEHPDVLEENRRRFRYVMVDEFQDTDKMQNRVVQLLAGGHKNICVVGDDDQCIYTWRGADISNILNFEKAFKGTRVIRLEQNYRSKGNILNAANSVIARNAFRKKKKLWTERGDGEKVRYLECYDEKDEARAVAREIQKGVSEGGSYSDYAVLYRTNAQSRNFEEAFSAFGIPYQVVGGLRYYDRKEIRDMLAYLRLVDNPNDNLSMRRIINEPKRGVGDKSLAKIQAYAEAYGLSLYAALALPEVLGGVSKNSAEALKALREAIAYFSETPGLRLTEIYDGLLERSGYLPALEKQEGVEALGRVENLMEFKSVLLDYEQTDPEISVGAFLEDISLISDIDNHDRAADSATLMTLHSAKGLEFPAVFLAGMEEGIFPSAQSVDRPDGVEEERRLCYVGMTRAKDSLTLLRAKARTLYGRFGYTIRSRFLDEIDKEFLDGAELLTPEQTGFFHRSMGAEDGYADGGNMGGGQSGFSGGGFHGGRYGGFPGYGRGGGSVVRPFDKLKAQREEARSPGAKGASYKAGDRVAHPKFGEGLVIETGTKTVTVLFGSEGKKKLATDVAPLEKI
ncbi:MAG: UvrD-helicase domain-containing protein [Clostridiales Family XIII bacterium]|jgi:DNA helicase-2/ATP-dependent DNA helicase PcrA|nr:UvrD-helicase domain-containing protein [Clostridiales Family XIII bacterium]